MEIRHQRQEIVVEKLLVCIEKLIADVKPKNTFSISRAKNIDILNILEIY